MTTLQEYLNNLENKEQITEINLEKINQEREQAGITELLEGGELDLKEFKNVTEIKIDCQLLTTPLTKIEVDGLSNLKKLLWTGEIIEESEENKKLWEELEIETDTDKQGVVREVKRLVELFATTNQLKIDVRFATEKLPQGELGDKDGLASENQTGEFNLYLQLDQKDKDGSFAPSLVFWTLARELVLMDIGGGEKDKSPAFWKQLAEELTWVRDNLIVLPIADREKDYRRQFELLLTPSTFPHEKLEMEDLLAVYYPNSEDKDLQSQVIVSKEVADKTWQTVWEKLIELVEKELKNNPTEEEKEKLAIKATIACQNEPEYIILIHHHSDSPFKEQIQELITTTPLKLEAEHSKQVIEELKQEKEQLPTPESFDKLTKQNQLLVSYLQDLLDEESYQEIKGKISKIN